MTYPSRSWVSTGDATLYYEVPPATSALEETIVTGLLTDLNNIYDLGLDTKPDLLRQEIGTQASKPEILVIGGSHTGRTGDDLRSAAMTSSECALQAGNRRKRQCRRFFRKLKTIKLYSVKTTL
jgi:hypothetical protein